MIKDLYIEDIPSKNELRKVLKILGDNSWTTTNINTWEIGEVHNIYYSAANNEYKYTSNIDNEKLKLLTNIKYKDFLELYIKPIENLKINETSFIFDSLNEVYKVLRVQDGYIYTNESNCMCYVPNKSLIQI